MLVLGFMSGTSLDGVDGAVIETDGRHVTSFGPAKTLVYNQPQRAVLQTAIANALHPSFRPSDKAIFCEAEAIILDSHVALARELFQLCGKVDLVGFHGQTVLHRPEQRLTLQIGDAAALSRTLAIPVIADLRLKDIQEGGQGAPLVPVYHAALADGLDLGVPLAFLNLGGISNVTWIGADEELLAFDIGPGNGLIDQLVAAHGKGNFDEDGRLALAGTIHQGVLEDLMQKPFFKQRGPKSLDRYDFSITPVQELSVEDGAATLAAFSAQAIAAAVDLLPVPPKVWVLCGGGRHNRALVQQISMRAGPCISADSVGLRGDFLEAEAIAFLAARSSQGLPITFPGTTGVRQALTGGRRYDPINA